MLRYDGETGAFIDVFASDPELTGPFGMQFGPDGNLFVSSRSTANILRFSGVTGEFIDIFAVGGGLQSPEGLTFGPDGNIYVSSDGTSSVLRYDGVTGDFIDVFAAGGGLSSPEDLVFGPDGNLYVSSFDTDNVLRYDGSTGSFLGVFAEDASLDAPSGLVFGADGNLFVSGFISGNVVRFNGATGAFIDVFATGGNMNGPTYLTFTDAGCLTQTSIDIICHADGTTFTVNVEGLNACTGGTTQFTFTASGGAAGEELCFTILVNADGGFCCSTEICVTIPDCSAQVQVCDFESLSVGDVVTDQYPGATFSSTTGNENVVLSAFGNKFICTRPVGQFQTCIEETFVEFTNPVNSLSFQAIALNTIGIVAAQVNVFVNGSFDSTVDIIGTGDTEPIIDLTAFSNVTRIEIVNIFDDPFVRNGIGWDNFSFEVMTELPSDLNGDGVVDIQDFLAFLGAWGQCSDCGTPPGCP